jgi:signal transduction histidine kinase
VSHDLRTPLTAISMFSHLVREGLERGMPLERTLGQLDSIERIVGGMDRLIQDLLDVARLEKGELKLSPREVSVQDVVEEILEVLVPVAEGKGVSIEAVLAETLPPVRADRDRMLQVLQNLLGNAVAFTPEAGHIRLEADAANGEGVRISVSDTGPGIALEDQPRIFESFWRGRGSGSGGAGLGLAIARGIVEGHGGRIWVESEPGQGSRFFFVLPVWEGQSLTA